MVTVPHCLPPSSPSDRRWFPLFLVAVSPERDIERVLNPLSIPQMPTMDAGRLATHVRRPRLRPKGSDGAEPDESDCTYPRSSSERIGTVARTH